VKATLHINEHELFRTLGSAGRNEGEWEILHHENVTACMLHLVAFDEKVRSKESSLCNNKRQTGEEMKTFVGKRTVGQKLPQNVDGNFKVLRHEGYPGVK